MGHLTAPTVHDRGFFDLPTGFMSSVRGGGLEPPWVSPYAPQTYASASFATRARWTRTKLLFLSGGRLGNRRPDRDRVRGRAGNFALSGSSVPRAHLDGECGGSQGGRRQARSRSGSDRTDDRGYDRDIDRRPDSCAYRVARVARSLGERVTGPDEVAVSRNPKEAAHVRRVA